MPTPSPTPLPSPTPTPPGNGNSNGSNNGNTNGNINGNNNGNANNNTNGNGYSAIDVSTAPILPENHPETTITHLFTPADTGTAAYALQAFSAISSVTYFMLPGNRLVIDIHSALSAIEGPFFVDPSLPISDVRSSQFSRRPNITRLVFDLIGPVEYSLTLSVDRRVLTVAFNKNRISDVELITETGTDTLLIRGDTLPAFRYVWDTPNRRLIIDVDNAAMYAPDINVQTATFVSRIETGQHPEGTAFIHVYFKEGITLPEAGVLNFDVNTIGLMFHQAISNVTYDFSARAVRLCRAGGFTMNVSQIQHFDEYLRSRYTMVLPHSANTLEQGIVQVGDGFIDSFMLARDVNGNTQLILNTSQVLAFEIYETPEAYYIFARLPKEVYSLVIVLDPGHGGNDPGVVRNGIREKDLVLTISHKVATLLNAHPYIGVYMTRREDTNPGVFWRAEFAESFADVFLSIHANGFTNTAIHGIETHYAISAAEAQRGQSFTSHTFAQIIQRNKIAQTNAHNRGLFNTPALIVLRESSIPSALAEIGYVSNATEAARLLTPAYQWQIARGIYDAILETHRIIGR
jgi:N-acetylmuramoyl-L-alanine amidase